MRISGIVKESIVDGPGFRYAIFTQGCPHRCEGCHNAHTWSYDGGYEITVEELFADIKSHKLLSGVTFTGGEPFEQAEQLAELALLCKSIGLEVAAYSGYTLEELLSDKTKLLLLTTLDVLVDGKFINAQKSYDLKFKGSKNQRILDVQSSLKENKPIPKTDGRWD